jgi:hypothetical protein
VADDHPGAPNRGSPSIGFLKTKFNIVFFPTWIPLGRRQVAEWNQRVARDRMRHAPGIR